MVYVTHNFKGNDVKEFAVLGHSEQQMQHVNICLKLLLSLTSSIYLLQV